MPSNQIFASREARNRTTALSLLALSLASFACAHPHAPHGLHARSSATAPASEVKLGFPYGREKIRGVNLGGWLVLEPWLRPELFEPLRAEVVDEYTMGQYRDDQTVDVLNRHWDTWYSEDDFRQIAEAGLNHVRLPIGYWAFDISHGEPYIQGQKPYLYKAISWAKKHGLKVMIDLHGGPGSQNGYDNSGQRGDALWATEQSNVDLTSAIIAQLAKEFADPQYAGVVTAIQPLNEPAGYLNDQLLQTYKGWAVDMEKVVRSPFEDKAVKSNVMFTFHDSFQSPSYWNQTFGKTPDTLCDTHHYQIFSEGELARSRSEQLQTACDFSTSLSTYPGLSVVGSVATTFLSLRALSLSSAHPRAVSHLRFAHDREWSLAITDCAFSLNGRGRGARWDGTFAGSTKRGDCTEYTGDGSTFSDEYKRYLRQYFDAQLQTYEKHGDGWLFWAWKAPNAAEWSYQAGIAGGWIPKRTGGTYTYTCN